MGTKPVGLAVWTGVWSSSKCSSAVLRLWIQVCMGKLRRAMLFWRGSLEQYEWGQRQGKIWTIILLAGFSALAMDKGIIISDLVSGHSLASMGLDIYIPRELSFSPSRPSLWSCPAFPKDKIRDVQISGNMHELRQITSPLCTLVPQ